MLENFTQEEIHRIDYLYSNDFKGITPDDASLIAKYEFEKAQEDAITQAKLDETKIYNDKRMKDETKKLNTAMSNLDELHTRALSRMDRLEKRERETLEQAQAKDGLHDGI